MEMINDYVLVEASEQKDTTESGLYVGTVSNNEPIRSGKVISVGPGTFREGVFVSVSEAIQIGKTILFDLRKCSEVTLEGKKYFVANARDILGVKG